MRLMLAEDSTLLREGLIRLLVEEGHEVLAAVGNADDLLTAVQADPPDLVVLDVRMPPTHTDEGLPPPLTSAPAGPLSVSWCCPSTWSAATRPS